MSKFGKALSVSLAVALLLSACGGGNSVKEIAPLTLEEVAGNRLAKLTTNEREGLIYRYVSDMIMVDRDNLIEVTNQDRSAINTLVSRINSDLMNGTSKYLTEEYANYLLTEFARTAYTWEYESTDIVGFDPATRFFFVDVTYKTTSNLKAVVPSSRIPLGAPDEEHLKSQRYSDYISYLNSKRNMLPEQSEAIKAEFERTWGSIDSIMEEQQGISLLKRTQTMRDIPGIGKLTYGGLVSEDRFERGAKMTIRYIFAYKFNLGEITDLGVEALYLKDYKVNNAEDLLKSYESSQDYGVEVLKPFIDETINSYHKAVEETNYVGLYSLHDNFANIDKYYQDIHNYTYLSIGGYNFKTLQRSNDNTVVVQVNRVYKIRARGANMSLPTYEETLIYRMALGNDDKIRVKSVNLVSSTLTGEPVSVIKNVSGISDLIQFSNTAFTETNKTKVENALRDFMQVVFEAKVDTDAFTNIVDIGVSQPTLLKISEYVTAIKDSHQKTNYIVAWETKTNVFVSVRVREIFETSQGTYDTEALVDLVNRNGIWKVVNYTRVQNVKVNGNTLSTKNALSQNKKS